MSIKPGDTFALGRHRLMCGDATDKDAVARLFDGRKPTLVVTSPPYAKQRAYDRPINCWDSMMMGALNGHACAADVQLLINLGVNHTQGEWSVYWWDWAQRMRSARWHLCAQYIWDKMMPLPGQNQGRARSEHEYIFHLRKAVVLLNETIANKRAGEMVKGAKYRDPNNLARIKKPVATRAMRPIGSVIRIYPERSNKTGHPAVFPVALPVMLISAWKKQNCATYDPFCGSGTTLLACEQEDVDGLGMEISPAYCQIAIERWNKAHPNEPARMVG